MIITNLIRKYEKDLEIEDKSADGKYIKGHWVEPQPIKRTFKGTAIPMTAKDLKLYEAGTYTTQDKKLFVISELKDSKGVDLTIKEGQIVLEGDIKYEVKDAIDATEFTGFKKYTLKKVIIDGQP